ALHNIEAIAAVEGVDALFLGPSDLAASLGYLGQPQHPAVRQAIEQALGRIAATGKAAGVYCADAAYARTCSAAGAHFIALGTDAGLLRQAATRLVSEVRSSVVHLPPVNAET